VRLRRLLSFSSIAGLLVGAVLGLAGPRSAHASAAAGYDCAKPSACQFGDYSCKTKCTTAKECTCTIY
jgi:hypothetical protein